MKLFFFITFIIASGVQLYASYKGYWRLKAGSKGFVLATLLGFYVAASTQNVPTMIMALVFSLLGDMLLIRSGWLVYGGFAFFFAHVMYIFSYMPHIVFSTIPAWVYILAAVFYAAVVFLILHILRNHIQGKLRVAAAGYIVSICIMSYFALLQMVSQGNAPSAIVFAGSMIFILSDFVLLIRNFRAEMRIKHKAFLVMLTYIIAQAMIVWGMLLLESAL